MVIVTSVSNKKKNIKVVDRGDKITVEGYNLKQEVAISLQMAISKGWKLENIISDGSDEFIVESKKQIQQLLKNQEFDKKSVILNENIELNNVYFDEFDSEINSDRCPKTKRTRAL